jgi:hypothetical protein
MDLALSVGEGVIGPDPTGTTGAAVANGSSGLRRSRWSIPLVARQPDGAS